MEDIKKRVEALLFSSGKRMHIGEIAKLCNSKPERIKQSLTELKKEYDEKDSSLILTEDGDFWKLTVRDQYIPIVQKIVTETELSKTVLETLAVIAFKYPILQSDLIKVRTNKAYDHLSELEEAGYISRQKHGRTKLIKLTDRFFEYFDLPQDKIKEQFKDFESIAKTIEEKEHEIKEIKEEQRKKAEEAKKEDEKIRQAAENADKEIALETYESEKSKEETEEDNRPKVIVAEEKLGSLEVVDEPPEEVIGKERERIHKIQEEDKKKVEEKEEKKKGKKKSVGIQLTKEMEKEVDKKVEEMLHPPKEESEEPEEEIEEDENKEKEFGEESGGKGRENVDEDEPKDLLEAAMEEEEKEEENKTE